MDIAAAEIGQMFFTAALGDFLVWNVRPTEGKIDIYQCETGDLGRLSLAAFHAGVRDGEIELRAALADVIRCPQCRGALELINDGTVDTEPAPFISCTQCAFCEDL